MITICSDNCKTSIFERILFLKLLIFVSLVVGTLKLVYNYSEIFVVLKVDGLKLIDSLV